MKNAIMVGAGDPAGKRICDDLEKLGWHVERVLLKGQAGEGVALDPLDHADVLAAGRQVAAKMWQDGADMLIVNVDGACHQENTTILDAQDYDALLRAYEYDAVGPLRVVNAFFPLLKRGKGKRICFVTTEEGSNSACEEIGGFGRHMSKASLNMAANLMFNGLRPEGFTMRMYCKDLHADDARVGSYAAEYFTRDRSNEFESAKHSDENRLVLRDSHARELPW